VPEIVFWYLLTSALDALKTTRLFPAFGSVIGSETTALIPFHKVC